MVQEKPVPEGDNSKESQLHSAACIRWSLNHYTASFYSYFGHGRETDDPLTRYFPADQVQKDPSGTGWRMPVVDERLKATIADLLPRAETLSRTDFDTMSQKAHDEMALLGQKIDSLAQKHHLPAYDPSLLGLLDERSAENLKSATEDQGSWLNTRGWESYSGEDKTPFLAVKTATGVDLLKFDDVFAADPEALRTILIDHYVASATGTLRDIVTYNLGIHQLAEEKIVPLFLQHLSQIDDESRRQQEFHEIEVILETLGKIDRDELVHVDGFLRRLSRTPVELPNDSRRAYLDMYLDHRAECDSEGELAQDHFEALRVLSTQIDADKQALIAAAEIEPADILRWPRHYTQKYLDLQQKNYQKELDSATRLQQFFGQDVTSQDLTSLMTHFQEIHPGLAQTLDQLLQSLAPTHASKRPFDGLIDETTRYADYHDAKMTWAQARESLASALYMRLWDPDSREKWGYIDRTDPLRPKIHLTDGSLADVLTYFAAVKAGAPKAFFDQLKETYQAKVKEGQNQLTEVDDHRIQIASFRKKHHLSWESVEELLALAKDNPSVFAALFNTLVLAKDGKINLANPSLKAVLAELYPDQSPETWAALADLN